MAKAESLKWTRTCILCGKKMVGVASNKTLCDSCLRIRQIEHDRKKAQNNKLEVVERTTPNTPRRILFKTMSGKRIGWA